MKSKIYRCLCFISILIILLVFVSHIMIPKNNTKEAGIHFEHASGIYAEEKNSIDLLVIGDSEPFTSIIPMELWNTYGYTSYICCDKELTILQSMQMLSKIFQNQKPKMLLIDANFFFRQIDTSDMIDTVFNIVCPGYEYHDRWKRIGLEDFTQGVNYNNINDQKGYYYTMETVPCIEEDIMNPPEGIKYISRINKWCLRTIKKYCNDNSIKIMFFRTPTNKDWNYSSYAGVKEFADKENIEYWDMNYEKEKLQLDYSQDSKDGEDHLNYRGALKTTRVLGEKLDSMKILTDHRGDEKYSAWEESMKKYKEIIENVDI